MPFAVYRYTVKLCGFLCVPVFDINVCCLHCTGLRTGIRYNFVPFFSVPVYGKNDCFLQCTRIKYKCVVFAVCLYTVKLCAVCSVQVYGITVCSLPCSVIMYSCAV